MQIKAGNFLLKKIRENRNVQLTSSLTDTCIILTLLNNVTNSSLFRRSMQGNDYIMCMCACVCVLLRFCTCAHIFSNLCIKAVIPQREWRNVIKQVLFLQSSLTVLQTQVDADDDRKYTTEKRLKFVFAAGTSASYRSMPQRIQSPWLFSS